jgi:hypothetical protein
MIGRGLRGEGMGGKGECVVIDIHDNIERHGEVEKVYNCFRDFWE